MTIYKHYYDPYHNKLISTKHDNIENRFGCYVAVKKGKNGEIINMTRFCSLDALETFDKNHFYTTQPNKENEVLQMVIEQQTQAIKDLEQKLFKLKRNLQVLEEQR